MDEDKVRKEVKKAIKSQGLDMAFVSRGIGKNHAYIQQFIERRVPKELSYKTANALAAYLNLDLRLFGYRHSSIMTNAISSTEKRLLNNFRNLDLQSQKTVLRFVVKTAKSRSRIVVE